MTIYPFVWHCICVRIWRGKGMKNMNFPDLGYGFLGHCAYDFVQRGAVKMGVLV